MEQWSADIANDPNNDYELLAEILYKEKDVAIIKQGKEGLELILYSHDQDLTIPCSWLLEIINNLQQAHNASKNTNQKG